MKPNDGAKDDDCPITRRIGGKLRKIRQQLKLTLEEVAARALFWEA